MDTDELLSELTDSLKPQGELRPLCRQAAETIARLRLALRYLQEASAPFANHDWYDAELEDDNCKLTRHSGPITVGHWRKLGKALNEARDT